MRKTLQDWINNEPTWLISPIRQIVNRSQRRSYLHQAEKINQSLNEVEVNFIDELHTSCFFTSYQYIYQHHLEVFKNRVDWFEKYGNLQNVKININYFSDKYKPIENV